VRRGPKGKEMVARTELIEGGGKRRQQLRFQWRRWLPVGRSGPVVTGVRRGSLRAHVPDVGGMGKIFTARHR
jgi:hypothetical protein